MEETLKYEISEKFEKFVGGTMMITCEFSLPRLIVSHSYALFVPFYTGFVLQE